MLVIDTSHIVCFVFTDASVAVILYEGDSHLNKYQHHHADIISMTDIKALLVVYRVVEHQSYHLGGYEQRISST